MTNVVYVKENFSPFRFYYLVCQPVLLFINNISVLFHTFCLGTFYDFQEPCIPHQSLWLDYAGYQIAYRYPTNSLAISTHSCSAIDKLPDNVYASNSKFLVQTTNFAALLQATLRVYIPAV